MGKFSTTRKQGRGLSLCSVLYNQPIYASTVFSFSFCFRIFTEPMCPCQRWFQFSNNAVSTLAAQVCLDFEKRPRKMSPSIRKSIPDIRISPTYNVTEEDFFERMPFSIFHAGCHLSQLSLPSGGHGWQPCRPSVLDKCEARIAREVDYPRVYLPKEDC